MPDGAAPAGRWRRTNWRAPTRIFLFRRNPLYDRRQSAESDRFSSEHRHSRGPDQSGAAARVVRSLDDLDQLAAAWDALAGGAGSPMQQFIWARACAKSYCRRGDQLHVVTVGPAGP